LNVSIVVILPAIIVRRHRPMGVQDFVDLIQRGGHLCPIELFPEGGGVDEEFDSSDVQFSTVGCAEAVLVLVPAKHTVREILTWNLPRFAEFPICRVGYDWDKAEFDGIEGYSEASDLEVDTIEGYHWNTWWNAAIWSSPSLPGIRIVNFTPEAYDVFVCGTVRPERVPWAYYWTILVEGRRDGLPLTKGQACRLIRRANADAVQSYDKYTAERAKAAKIVIEDDDPLWEELGL
jgi:hypothetical protein